MRIMFIGDIVGTPGMDMVTSNLKYVIEENGIDFVIANGENAATGNGITAEKAHKLEECGVNVITLGNHSFAKPDAAKLMDSGFPMVRPINYPDGTPGTGCFITVCKGKKIAVISALGRVFMNPVDSPFTAVYEKVKEICEETDFIFVDFHAEATSEKAALAWFLDGKVSAVIGTHTHVQTADERLLPKGTAFITDVGMTGPYNSILGVDKDISVSRFTTLMNRRYAVAEGNCKLDAVIMDTDEKAVTSVKRYSLF